jgi:hypothetical protein
VRRGCWGEDRVDWPDLSTLTHWQAILAAIVAIGTPIVAILGWFKPLLSWFRTLFKRKAQPKSAPITFVPNDLRCHWSGVRLDDQSGTFVNGHWHVTNSSERNVKILKARLGKYATPFVGVSTHHPEDERAIFGDYPIHAGRMSEVSVDFTLFPPIGRAPKPIISDVIFTDNFRNEHRVRTQFYYIGPDKPS